MVGSVGVTQRIRFPEKLHTSGRIAEQDVRIGLGNLADVRIRAVADVGRSAGRAPGRPHARAG